MSDPHIPEDVLSAVQYVYLREDDAEQETNATGTTFLLSVPSSDSRRHLYAVASRHLSMYSANLAVRTSWDIPHTKLFPNLRWLPTPPNEGPDINAAHLLYPAYDFPAIPLENCLTKRLPVGTELVLIGRDRDNETKPAVRIGKLEANDHEFGYLLGEGGSHICISNGITHSIPSQIGFSGSPVFIFEAAMPMRLIAIHTARDNQSQLGCAIYAETLLSLLANPAAVAQRLQIEKEHEDGLSGYSPATPE